MSAEASETKDTAAWTLTLDESTSSKSKSLQAAFRTFRQRKQRERALRPKDSADTLIPTRTLADIVSLRLQFVQRALRYIGVPYKRSVWPPGTPEYDSPIFLDCCGLVRRVARDMEDQLGFRIGPWNQAYMFDTLYREERDLGTAQPGDLVFYAGKYVNPKSKRQKFDMVHVEIFLRGTTGEETVASRWKTGKVNVFPSYMFAAKNWTDVRIFFRSIDPWLRGECQPQSGQFEWKRRSLEWMSHRRSVFREQESAKEETDEEDHDEAADYDDDDA